MGYISRVKDKGLYKKPSFWLAWAYVFILPIVALGIFLGPAIYDSYLSSQSHTEICTVNSAEYKTIDGGGANGPAPSAALDVSTSCGDFTIHHIDSPSGMNHGALVRFFNEHQGQKFEFIVEPPSIFSLGDESGVARGIHSTTPVK